MCAKTIGMDVQVSRVKTMIPPVFVALPASATVLLPVWSYIAKLHNFKSKALKSFVRESAMLPWPPYQRWQPRYIYIYIVPICSSRSQFYYNFLMRSQSSAFGKAAQQGYHCQRGRQWRWSKSTNILTKEVRFPIEHGIFEYLVQVSVVQPQPLCRCVSILHFELRDGWITIHRKVHAVNSLGQHSTVSVGCCDTGVVEGAQHRGKAPARNCTGANNAVAVVSTNLDVSQWRILFFGQWIHSDKPPIFQTKMTLSEMTTCTTRKKWQDNQGRK